jgi:ATP synthase protein I
MGEFRWLRGYSEYIYMGLMFPSCIGVGAVAGYWIDKKFHTGPWGFLIGFFFGVIAGFVNLFRDYQRMQKKNDDATKN